MMAEPLWFNDLVTDHRGRALKGGKWTKWAQGKFHKVKDLWNPVTETWFTAEEAKQWVPKSRRGELDALMQAVPSEWREALEQGPQDLQTGEWASGVDAEGEDLAEPHGQVLAVGTDHVELALHLLNEEGVLAPTGATEEVHMDLLIRTRVIQAQVKKRKFLQLAGELEDLSADPTKWGVEPQGKEKKARAATALSVKEIYKLLLAPTARKHKLPWRAGKRKTQMAKLKRLASKGVDKKSALHSVKVLHRRLFIGDRIVKHAHRGMHDAARCACCGGLETHTHLFFGCVQELVELFLEWWNHCTGQGLVVKKKVEWVVGLFEGQTHGPVWEKLHAEVIYFIWLERCTAKHEGTRRPPAEALWSKLHKKLEVAVYAELYVARQEEAILAAKAGKSVAESDEFRRSSPLTKWQSRWKGLVEESGGKHYLVGSGL